MKDAEKIIIEITPNILWKLVSFDRTNTVKTIIGKSVIIGAIATFKPDLISC